MKHTKYLLTVAIASVALASSVFAATGSTTSTGATATTTATTATSSGASISDSLNVPGAPTLVSKTSTGVTLSWAKVDAAKYYVVKYSKTSVAKAFAAGNTSESYTDETDRVTATGTTISDLKAGTTYYFSVVALDATAKNESTTNSEELPVEITADTATATASGTLKLASVNVITDTTLTLDFSAPVSKTPPVSVRVKKTSDSSTVPVLSVTADPTNAARVIVTLSTPLSTSSSYNILVIDAADVNGLPISAGVNAEKEFATAATLAKAETAEATGTGTTGSGMTGSGVPTDLNAAPEVAPVTALPKTGTQENILFVMAAILALGIMYGIQKKKQA